MHKDETKFKMPQQAHAITILKLNMPNNTQSYATTSSQMHGKKLAQSSNININITTNTSMLHTSIQTQY